MISPLLGSPLLVQSPLPAQRSPSPLEADRDVFGGVGGNSGLAVHFEINIVLKGYLGYPFVGSNSDGPVETDHWHDVG